MHFRFLSLPLLGFALTRALAQIAAPAAAPPTGDITHLDTMVVSDQLDETRGAIQPSLGATSFIIDQKQILNLPQGADAPFSQVLLRAPGVAEDSSANGDLHVRGEHANLQYRINDVLLPEGISGFGLELDPRFVQSMQLITGALPAQYGFRTAGIVDITTKTGGISPGGSVSLYGGSFDTVRPSFELGGSQGSVSYFVDGSFDHNSLGIENPTASWQAVHDDTNEYKSFAYLSYILDHSSRLTFMGSLSSSTFQVPDTPGLQAGTSPDGSQWLPGTFDSSKLDETQDERNIYGVVTYQKSAGDLNYQLSAFGRGSSVHFKPDVEGDLFFNGAASDVDRKLASGGIEGDGSQALGSDHTLRAGFSFLDESASTHSVTTVFPVNDEGDPTGKAFSIDRRESPNGLFAGSYVQDEWKISPQFTLNGGLRFDLFDASFDREGQVSPRISAIYTISGSLTVHGGYSRYFTPPPVENVSGGAVRSFDNTSNASATDQDDPVKAERADYFDVGVSKTLASGLQLGLDGYYKRASDQLDDGLFGQTLILSAFNYAKGKVYGLEGSASYSVGRFSTYLNLAHSVARGIDWNSSEFLFDPSDLDYVRSHWIHLDHDQALSASFGASYAWKEAYGETRAYIDTIYGTGLRTDATAADGSTIPNGGSVPAYYTISVGGQQTFKAGLHKTWSLRIDVLNVTDKVYELRDGSGVGVNAAQYGMRRGLFGSVDYAY